MLTPRSPGRRRASHRTPRRDAHTAEVQSLEARVLMITDDPCGVWPAPTIPDFCPTCGGNFASVFGAIGGNAAGQAGNAGIGFGTTDAALAGVLEGLAGMPGDGKTRFHPPGSPWPVPGPPPRPSTFHERDALPNKSAWPVRYFDGLPILKSTDLAGNGLTHTRSWSAYEGTNQGFGWESSDLPRLLRYDLDTIAVISGGGNARFFDKTGSDINGDYYTARDFTLDTLQYVNASLDYLFRDTAGNEWRFLPEVSNVGRFKNMTEAGTDVVTTAAYDGPLVSLTRTVRQLVPGTDPQATRVDQESFVYGYNAGANYVNDPGLITRVTLQRRTYQYTGSDPNPSATTVPWTPVRQADYDYYETAWADGNPQLPGRKGDLRTASVSDPSSTRTVGGATVAGSTVTLTVNGHGYQSGDTVVVSGSTADAAYNGTYVITVINSNSFQFTTDAAPWDLPDPSNLRVVKPLDTSFYRYWQGVAPASNFSPPRIVSPVKLVVNADSYARLRAAGVNPLDPSTTDDAIKPYADHYFRYQPWQDHNSITADPAGYKTRYQVIEEVAQGAGCSACSGGQGTFKFEYGTNTHADPDRTTTQYNFWRYRTTEYLPDTTNADANSDGIIDATEWNDNDRNIVFTNEVGEVMLKVYQQGSAGPKWITYQRYDTAGRLVMIAEPSAVTGYSELNDDLLNNVGGNYQYLADSQGLITEMTYQTAATSGGISETVAGDVQGYYKSTSIRKGETGTLVPQEAVSYFKRVDSVGGATIYPLASETIYSNTNGTGARTTQYQYTWLGTTVRPASVKTILSPVTTGNNGPASSSTDTANADTFTEYFDNAGRTIFTKDGEGYANYFEYDDGTPDGSGGFVAGTGALRKTILDANTSTTSDFNQAVPTGLTSPAGTRLRLTTSVESDKLGRPKKVTEPSGNVTVTVYLDAQNEVQVYRGWVVGANANTGPVEIARQYRPAPDSGKLVYDEFLATTANRTLGTDNLPTGALTIDKTNIVALSRDFTNKAGQSIVSDRYFFLDSLTAYERDVSPASGSDDTPVNLGTKDTHFYRTVYGYNKRGRLGKVVDGAGTITRIAYDGLDRVVSTWIGTDDTGWTESSTSHANMVKVSENQYDNNGVGDSNLTKTTAYPGGTAAARVSVFFYDWRDRLVAAKAGEDGGTGETVQRQLTYYDYDNLDEVTAGWRYDADTITTLVDTTPADGVPDKPAAGRLRAKTEVSYDEQGRPRQYRKFSVSQTTGAGSSNSLRTDLWYDRRGEVIKQSEPGGLVYKSQFDGAGRPTKSFVTDGGAAAASPDTTWAHARDVAGDNVLEQTEYLYDLTRNAVLVTSRRRFHNEADLGDLTNAGIDDRANYAATYYDTADRLIYSVDYGTNGGTAVTAPHDAGTWPAAALVTEVAYPLVDTGRPEFVFDPSGTPGKTEYDLLGRVTRTIEGYSDEIPSAADDRITEHTYDGADHVVTDKAVLPDGPDAGTDLDWQTTQYVYGVTTAGGSDLNSNDLLAEIRYPDKTSGNPGTTSADKRVFKYNALGDRKQYTDQNGSVHDYAYDIMGRILADKVSTLGAGVDGRVLRLGYTYTSNGQMSGIDSYDSLTLDNVVTHVGWAYNGLGDQTTQTFRSHAGGASGSVNYAYSWSDTGSTNHSRLTSMTYPSGRVITYDYGTSTSLNTKISRVGAIKDGATTLEGYSYLGLSTIVETDHPQTGIKLTYIAQGTADQPMEAGDQYVGLDRFDRVVDQRWRKTTGTVSDVDRFVYTYDRDSNRLTKDVLAAGNPGNVDEKYTYDSLNRLAAVSRGTLVSGNITAQTFSQTWALDALGNWDSLSTNGAPAIARAHNKRNQIETIAGSTSPVHDNNGNMTRDETGRLFKYDAWDHLVAQVTSGGADVVRYTVDGRGYRVQRIVTGQTINYFYTEDWQLVEEKIQGGATQATYVWGLGYVDALVARDHVTHGRQYAQQDANYNVTSVASTAGVVQERYMYDPYGTFAVKDASWGVRGASSYGWVYLHQGGRYDSGTGLYHFRNRDYSATLGRWVQPDPLGYVDGVNVYQAYWSGPVTFDDPSGLRIPEDERPRGTDINGNPYWPAPYDPHMQDYTPPWWEPLAQLGLDVVSELCFIAAGFAKGPKRGLRSPLPRNAGGGASPYKNVPNSKNTAPGRSFSPAHKRRLLEENLRKNNGSVTSDKSGIKLSRAQQGKRGQTPCPNEAHVDHNVPKSKGGENSSDNARILSREENLRKGNKQ